MSFDAYAVASRHGPHVTLQAGVVHLGRHWTTTTRRSVKAAAVRRTGRAAALVAAPDGGHRLVAGAARTLDPTRPWTALEGGLAGALAAGLDGALVGGAIARLGAAQLEQVLGYLEAGRAVPGAFLPWGRVVLVTDVAHDVELPAQPDPVPAQPAGAPAAAVPRDVPGAVARLAAQPAPCHVGVAGLGGTVALPAAWDPGEGSALVARAALDAVGAVLPGPACVTLDESAERRPDRKLGLLLRGRATTTDVGPGTVAIRVAPARVSWWTGFSSGTSTTARA